MDKSKIVVIRSFLHYNEAILYKAMFDGAGIESKLLNETINNVLPLNTGFSQIYLVVREEDEKKALDLINAHFDKRDFVEESSKAAKEKR